MSATVIRGDARNLPLPDASVDLLVTSPPYFGLRSYTDGGEHYGGQIGSEATPAEWLAAMLDCTREWVRVLKPSGSIFVNLGDKYAGGGMGGHGGGRLNGRVGQGALESGYARPKDTGVRDKSLLGLPWRYALACMDDLGLILRAEIIWQKPNGLPESVTDRVRRSHEQVFHFTKQPRYYAAVDEIRTPHAESTMTRGGGRNGLRIRQQPNPSGTISEGRHDWEGELNALGSLPGSVWEIPSQPLTVPAHLGIDHFAAFPMELPRRIILGWSPPGICTACNEGRRPVATTEYVNDRQRKRPELRSGFDRHSVAHRKPTLSDGPGATTITGYACACPEPTAPTRRAVVVDPFGGTGTTALVASMLGRDSYSFDLSADYCRLARWRVTDPAERAKALGVPKPPPVADGQESLFEAAAVPPLATP